jgi:uncharacterized SAM-binding protein YcdF (DUF218 family)
MSETLILFKKFLLYLFYPSTLIFLFLLLVAIYVILEKRRERRRLLLFVAVFLYYLSTTPVLPYLLLKSLERGVKQPNIQLTKEVKYIVLLTGGINLGENLSLEEKITSEGMRRLLGTLKILRENPKAKLIILGGSYEEGKEAEYYRKFLENFGVKALSIDTPLDTLSSAKDLKNILPQGEPFLLLSSAYHLPRATFIFRKEGLNPIPYPTHFAHHLCVPRLTLRNLFPKPLYLDLTNIAVHEYLGLAYYKLKYMFVK